jgi:selenide,water dikinase
MRARVLREGSFRALLGRGEGPTPDEEAAAVASMARLNRSAARAADVFDVAASTDVTGYGLLGHLKEMLGGGGVSAEISVAAVPVLAGARRLVSHGFAPDGSRRNLAAARPGLDVASEVAEEDLLLATDAQTSGGLLLAVRASQAEALVEALRAAGDAPAAIVGRFSKADAGSPAIRVGP